MIAFNHGAGIAVVDVPRVGIRLNSIYSNGGLGIDLTSGNNPDGVTGNDPGDAGGLQHSTVLGSAINSNGSRRLLSSAARVSDGLHLQHGVD